MQESTTASQIPLCQVCRFRQAVGRRRHGSIRKSSLGRLGSLWTTQAANDNACATIPEL